MSERKVRPFSERCRAIAEECWTTAKSFRSDIARNEIFQLADDYDRKALQAEEIEATLRAPHDESPSLNSRDSRGFCKPVKIDTAQSD